MKVSELMDPKGVLLYAKIDNSADALGILVELQEGIGVITNGNAYYNAVSQRETFGGTTAIGGGIALPHASNAGVSAPGHLGIASAPRCGLGCARWTAGGPGVHDCRAAQKREPAFADFGAAREPAGPP